MPTDRPSPDHNHELLAQSRVRSPRAHRPAYKVLFFVHLPGELRKDSPLSHEAALSMLTFGCTRAPINMCIGQQEVK